MMNHYFLPKEWMVSATARRVYRNAAVTSVAFFVLLVSLQFVGKVPNSWAAVVRLALLLGIGATALTLVAMEYFLFGFDKSSDGKKALWFTIMLLPILGAALYCLIAYSRQAGSTDTSENLASGASA